ncbi:hypothetical protein COU76_05235 [Candidatus Peregrinibacteria bacterium CG10_big_fil_rev_8_21_14_0_10_49_10]|nr:MAG: hypothetical protein COU76_05235 [Candidatus Peregrinibacteria bacterium CG10_big_fil_rev_8_21_14_0_10_49_10]
MFYSPRQRTPEEEERDRQWAEKVGKAAEKISAIAEEVAQIVGGTIACGFDPPESSVWFQHTVDVEEDGEFRRIRRRAPCDDFFHIASMDPADIRFRIIVNLSYGKGLPKDFLHEYKKEHPDGPDPDDRYLLQKYLAFLCEKAPKPPV